MKDRFSKRTVLKWAERRMAGLEARWNLDPGNGYAQVENRSAAANRAYGEYATLRSLIEAFDLQGAA